MTINCYAPAKYEYLTPDGWKVLCSDCKESGHARTQANIIARELRVWQCCACYVCEAKKGGN